MEYTGYAPRSGEVVFRGTPKSREFTFWLAERRVVAGMNVNVWDVAPSIERLIKPAPRSIATTSSMSPSRSRSSPRPPDDGSGVAFGAYVG